MNTPHKHADIIKQWADGAEIEHQTLCPVTGTETWACTTFPAWDPDTNYRVKSRPPTYGEVALAAWSTDCDWELVASAVIAAYKAREGGGGTVR